MPTTADLERRILRLESLVNQLTAKMNRLETLERRRQRPEPKPKSTTEPQE